MKNKIKINLIPISSIFVVLPIIIFFLGWMKLLVAIPASLMLLVATGIVIKNSKNDDKYIIKISKGAILALGGVALILCVLSGIGGFFFQSSDHNARNAIFKDLLYNNWPVVYPQTDRALVYYFAIWLFPALIGKLSVAVGASAAAAWIVAKIFLLIYCTVGIFIVFALISKLTNMRRTKTVLFAALIFVFFSGMDIIGFLGLGRSLFPRIHIEWWSSYFQLSSFTTCLFWVYNQCIIPWIITAVIMLKKETKSLAFWGLIALPYGPFPFVGIFAYCIVIGIINLIKNIKSKKTSQFFKDVFSLPNIFSVVAVGITYLLFYTSNSIASGVDSSKTKIINLSADCIICWVMLIVIEVLPFFLLLLKDNKKNPYFYATFAMIIAFTPINIGSGGDFCMRATIPPLFMICIFVIKKIKKLKNTKNSEPNKKMIAVLLTIVLTIGAVTPATEFFRGFYHVAKEKTIFLEDDSIPTFANRDKGVDNFTAKGYENSAFFKYLAKK